MIILMMGCAGSGKGTQASIISQEKNLIHLSMGDLFRNLQGKLKEKADSYVNKGNLVPDELTVKVLKQAIGKHKDAKGFILDGFPRNINQAKELDKQLTVNKVIGINLTDEEAIKRLSARWTCGNCEIGYNYVTAPKPKQEGICDKCQGLLTHRDDDNPEAIKKRLDIYHNKTSPIFEHYKDKLITINGEQEIQKVTEDILEKI